MRKEEENKGTRTKMVRVVRKEGKMIRVYKGSRERH